MLKDKKILYSAMQSTGNLTLGNYLGALRNWVKLSNEYTCFFCIANLHSLSVRQDPVKFRKKTKELLAMFIAAGLDPNECCLYIQSTVKAHAELAWILGCYSYIGELQRMTQFKDKSQKHVENINAGLFTYPVLMASDILLFQTDIVPIGKDQKQHLELTRDIAIRFNNIYGDVFTIPEAYIGATGAKINSLAEPEKKMSKSDENPNGAIYLMDDKDSIIRKFKRAVTDSVGEINYSSSQPGIKNLIEIYCSCKDIKVEEALKDFEGLGYKQLKEVVGECVADTLEPFKNEYNRLLKDSEYIDNIIKNGAEQASYFAEKTLSKVKRKVGLS